MRSDYHIADHGSILLLYPITPECEEWVEEHVGGQDTQYWGDGLVVEKRYIGPIIRGLESEGFIAA